MTTMNSFIKKVKLHKNSEKYIKDTFSRYTEIDNPQLSDRIDLTHGAIIHMYPVGDTTNKHGEKIGYCDSIFFKIKIYDTHARTVITSKDRFDAIEITQSSDIRIFKDGSTLITLRRPIKISLTQAILVENL